MTKEQEELKKQRLEIIRDLKNWHDTIKLRVIDLLADINAVEHYLTEARYMRIVDEGP